MHTLIPDVWPTLDADEAKKWGNNQWVDAGKALVCPDVANPLTARMHKGINTTADEGQTAIVEVADPLIAKEGETYTHEGKGNFRTRNVVLSSFDETQVTHPENRSTASPDTAALANQARPPTIAFKASHYTRGKDGAPADLTPPLSADADKGDQDTLVAHSIRTSNTSSNGWGIQEDVSHTLDQTAGPAIMAATTRVRRLTPRECERLQGFPDDYTDIRHNGRPASDTARYRALGNSMAVPVMRWIGQRIQQYEENQNATRGASDTTAD